MAAQAIELLGYPVSFCITALFPVAAAFAVPAGAIHGAAGRWVRRLGGAQDNAVTAVSASSGRTSPAA